MNGYELGTTKVVIKHGDLLDEDVDAIVCPANSFNQMRGGIAGVIRQRGGEIIEQEAMALAPVAVGQAVITSAGKLRAKHVIHAPTMKMPVQTANADAVRQSVRASLACADHHRFRSIAFPGMGTGIGGVPYDEAATVMLQEIKRYLSEQQSTLQLIAVVAHSTAFYDALEAAAKLTFGIA